MSWNEKTTNLLKKYWREGFTASQISEKIGNVTRNAVIGKAHRLNLESRSRLKKVRTKTNRDSNIPPKAKTQKLKKTLLYMILTVDAP